MAVDLAFIDESRQEFQAVKCVVVGDSGVGKTRLVCARACGTPAYSLQQLMQTHVPTVWAIDHYRKDKDVFDRSWCTIDGLSISLRLWDTFGYHDKDRRFALHKADVILLCFSVASAKSLKNVLQCWYPEIKRLCPRVPIILCGCQVDLRYLYNKEEFLDLDKGPFFREIQDKDIVYPNQARAIAKEINARYYETSVLVPFGINELFTNVIRAALVNKRDRHFWKAMGGLKRISKPQVQAPFLPPKPEAPEVATVPLDLGEDLGKLLESQVHCDVIFVVQGICFQAHKVCLAVAATVFEDLFLMDVLPANNITKTLAMLAREPKTTNLNSSKHGGNHHHKARGKLQRFNSHTEGMCGHSNKKVQSDTAKLLEYEDLITSSMESIITDPSSSTTSVNCLPVQTLNHPAFRTIEVQECDDVYNPGKKVVQTIVTLNDNVTAAAFRQVLYYLYTGCYTENYPYNTLAELHTAASLLGLKDLVIVVQNMLSNDSFMNKPKEFRNKFFRERSGRVRQLLIRRGLFADVIFQLDDDQVLAHRALLMTSCDVMTGMFSNNFRESSAKVISFPGVCRESFVALQEYLYTGQCPCLTDIDCLALMELANRMCLRQLLSEVESFITKRLTLEEAISLLEPSQLHNASQLAHRCLWQLCVHYKAVYKKYSKLLQTFHPDNQIHLSKHRWPPLWYLKESEYYEKCLVDQEREQVLATTRSGAKSYARRGSGDIESGCLSFCTRAQSE